MKHFLLGVVVAILAAMTWRLLSSLSSDALGMAVGLIFGILAGIPMAVLALASSRRQAAQYDDDDDYDDDRRRQQPTVILLAAPQGQQPQVVNNYNYTDNRQVHVGSTMPLIADREQEVAAQRSGRVFRVVGEREEL